MDNRAERTPAAGANTCRIAAAPDDRWPRNPRPAAPRRDPARHPLATDPAGAEVYLAIDVDGIDPSEVPGVLLPAFGGLSDQRTLDVILGAAARARIVGADFVEYAPANDPTGVSARVIARLVGATIAAIMRGRG